MSECQHIRLSFDVVETVRFAYRQPSEQQRLEALRVSQPVHKKRKIAEEGIPAQSNNESPGLASHLPSPEDFPAPKVLPGHDLALAPNYPPQPVQECLEIRNPVTQSRKTIYIAAPPKIPKGLAYVKKWMTPSNVQSEKLSKGRGAGHGPPSQPVTPSPSIEAVREYVEAFYHGMEVKILTSPALEWMAWDSVSHGRKSKKKTQAATQPDCIGLSTGKELLRIQSRPSPDGTFSGQLNQNHLLEVAIDILPEDAYALLMLVDHDLFEDEDDDFCCGRAYGGSRVCLVSTARYRPELDKKQKIDLEHVWPASHCLEWGARFFSNKTLVGLPKDKKHCQNAAEYYPDSAVAAAVVAHLQQPMPSSTEKLATLWLGRICKTASHELGHCIGMDHCVYWACLMQGSASIVEDHRQPPYLCPVDLSKVLRATGASEQERYKALLKFCDKQRGDRLFAAYGAWIRALMDR